MAWSGNVQIHGVPNTGYPGQPNIYSYVSFGDVWREGSTLACNVSASLNAMGARSYFGYYITVYAQIDEGALVQLYHKPNSPNKWNSDVYKGSGTVYSTNTGDVATLSIWFESQCGGECWGAKKPYKMFSVVVGAPPMSPPTVRLSNTGYNASYLSWVVNTDVACDRFMYSLDARPWIEYYVGAGTTVTYGSLNVTPEIHDVWLGAHRVNGQWGYSNHVQWDCRLPNIVDAKISSRSVDSGILSFHTDYDVNYYLNDVYLGRGSNNISVPVSLGTNVLKDYTLVLKRVENADIYSSTNIRADTTYANLQLSAEPYGSNILFGCSSDVICDNWYLMLSWTDKSGTTHSSKIDKGVTQTNAWETFVKDLDIDIEYSLQVFATKATNNVLSSSNIVKVQPEACAHIVNSNGQYITAVPYVYDDILGWQKVYPYVYDDKTKSWKVCT